MLFYSSQFPFSVSPVVWVLPFVDAKFDMSSKLTPYYIYKKNIPHFCTFITSVYKADRDSQNSSCHMSTAQHLPANKTSGLPASLQTWTVWPETHVQRFRRVILGGSADPTAADYRKVTSSQSPSFISPSFLSVLHSDTATIVR